MYLILILLFLTGCSNTEEATSSTWVSILGRNETDSLKRFPVYHAKVPHHWIHSPPPLDIPLTDTTKPIDEFFIVDGNDKVRITIHNFPSDKIEDRIPPAAQITRWKRQFTQLAPADTLIVSQARGGFAGLFFSATGMMQGAPYAVLGWSMQMAPEHYRILTQHDTPLHKQMRADYTIKAVGSPTLINTHRNDIESFAHSFELLQEVPPPSWE